MGQRQSSIITGHRAQLASPVGVGGVYRELGQHDLGHAVQQGSLIWRVAVEDHRIAVELASQATHRQPVDPLAVDELQRGDQNKIPRDLAVTGGTGARRRAVAWVWGHRREPSLLVEIAVPRRPQEPTVLTQVYCRSTL